MFLELDCLPKPTSSDTGTLSLEVASFCCAGALAFPSGGSPILQVWGMGTVSKAKCCWHQLLLPPKFPELTTGCAAPSSKHGAEPQPSAAALLITARVGQRWHNSGALLCWATWASSAQPTGGLQGHLTSPKFFSCPPCFWGAQGVQSRSTMLSARGQHRKVELPDEEQSGFRAVSSTASGINKFVGKLLQSSPLPIYLSQEQEHYSLLNVHICNMKIALPLDPKVWHSPMSKLDKNRFYSKFCRVIWPFPAMCLRILCESSQSLMDMIIT